MSLFRAVFRLPPVNGIPEGDMNRTLELGIVFGTLVISPTSLQTKDLRGTELPRLSLMVCDMAKTKPATLVTAKDTIRMIFSATGIETRWVDLRSETCALPPAED